MCLPTLLLLIHFAVSLEVTSFSIHHSQAHDVCVFRMYTHMYCIDCACVTHEYPCTYMFPKGGGRHHKNIYVDPLLLIIPPPNSRTTPSSDTPPHTSTIRYTSSPGFDTYSQSVPLSTETGAICAARPSREWLAHGESEGVHWRESMTAPDAHAL